MKHGAHSFMWTAAFGEKDLYLFDKLKRMGFDGIEIHMHRLDILPKQGIKEKISETGIEGTFSAGLARETNISSPDKTKRKAAIEYLERSIDTASELGSDILGGVIYAAWGGFTGKVRTNGGGTTQRSHSLRQPNMDKRRVSPWPWSR